MQFGLEKNQIVRDALILPIFTLKAGISMHPSHPNVINALGEQEIDILKNVKSPQLFMPSGSDSASVKKGGLSKQILGDFHTDM